MNGTQTIARTNLRIKPLVACLLVPLAIGNLPCIAVLAAQLPVTNCYDTGVGSLRAAIAAAQSGDTIDLSALTCSTITLEGSELTLAQNDLTLQGTGNVSINGSDLGGQYVIHHTGTGALRVNGLAVWHYDWGPGPACILSSGNVTLDNAVVPICVGTGVDAKSLTMRNSVISYSSGGVHTTGGAVSIVGSTISHNFSGTCSGLEIGGGEQPVLISNSTISGNQSAGCISQPTTIVNSTIAFNGDSYHGISGELSIASPQVTIESSIFANNKGEDLQVTGAASIAGHNNLVMVTGAGTSALPADTLRSDPLLLPLANNGGPTATHALAAGSLAIDAGSNSTGLATDQRGNGYARVAGARADIGAFELQPAASTSGSIGPGFTGSWFDPAQSGQGLMLEVLSDNRLLALWFSFNPQGNQQAWFGGVGTYSGNTATITDVALPTGGRWIPNFDQNAILLNPWGTLTVTFTDCNHGRVDFSSTRGYGSGGMNLTRLTQPAGLTCP
jgi:hypothetical protein